MILSINNEGMTCEQTNTQYEWKNSILTGSFLIRRHCHAFIYKKARLKKTDEVRTADS